MSTISLRLPNSLHKELKELSKREGVSINQLATSAVAEKLSALMTAEYLKDRANRASRKGFEDALSKVADAEPDEKDHLPVKPNI